MGSSSARRTKPDLMLVDLPDLVFQTILSALDDPKDVLSCSQGSKALLKIARSDEVWKRLLQTHYGLSLKRSRQRTEDDTQIGSFQSVFQELSNKHYGYMPFVAAYTDGGVQPTEARSHSQWVDNIFQEHMHGDYCSVLGRNIHAFAVLMSDRSEERLRANVVDEHFQRVKMIDKLVNDVIFQSLPPGALREEVRAQLQDKSQISLAHAFLERQSSDYLVEYLMTCIENHTQDPGVPSMLFKGLEGGRIDDEIMDLDDIMQRAYCLQERTHEPSAPTQIGNTNNWRAQGTLQALQTQEEDKRTVGEISGLKISIRGDYTNPVSTAVLFAIHLPHGGQAFERSMWQNETVFEELANSSISQMFNDCSTFSSLEAMCLQGCEGRVLKPHTGVTDASGRWVELSPGKFNVGSRGMALEPILWSKFWTPLQAKAFVSESPCFPQGQMYNLSTGTKGLAAFRALDDSVVQESLCENADAQSDYAERPDGQRFRRIEMDYFLRYRRGCNAVMVKLIDSDNLYPGAASPAKIEIAQYCFSGREATLPSDVCVHSPQDAESVMQKVFTVDDGMHGRVQFDKA